MKKVKLMLSAFAVIAIVGTALAFKAKPFSTSFCASTTSGGTCALVENKRIVTTGGNQYYRDLDYGIDCNSSDVCNQSVLLADN